MEVVGTFCPSLQDLDEFISNHRSCLGTISSSCTIDQELYTECFRSQVAPSLRRFFDWVQLQQDWNRSRPIEEVPPYSKCQVDTSHPDSILLSDLELKFAEKHV